MLNLFQIKGVWEEVELEFIDDFYVFVGTRTGKTAKKYLSFW